ncbi:MAG: hypothetical protein AAF657_10405 [Acidobacteriota bacterium]
MNWTPRCGQEDTFEDIDPFDSMCTRECTYDNDTCAELCPSFGCLDYALSDTVDPSTNFEEQIILDNDGTIIAGGGSVTTIPGDNGVNGNSPDWRNSVSSTPPFKGSDYMHDRNDGRTGPYKSIVYDPTITNAGTYQVWMSWPPSLSSRATNVMVDITHDGGVDTVVVDQRASVDSGAGTQFDGWNLLGTYELSSANGEVEIRNEAANNFVLADAVRWTRIVIPACLERGFRCQQPICPLGDCYASLNGDDPSSKFYQAKEAMYEALDSVETVHFGFGHYQQDNLRMQMKHWLYRVRTQDNADPPNNVSLPVLTVPGSPPETHVFLEEGDEIVFGNYSLDSTATPASGTFRAPGEGYGDGWDCENSVLFSIEEVIGCNSTYPADVTDEWERTRANRIPKLGFKGTYETDIWYRVNQEPSVSSGTTMVVRYKPRAGFDFGDEIFAADVEVFPCDDATCTPTSTPVYFDLVSDYGAWDNTTSRQPMQEGGFFSNQRNIFAGDDFSNLGFEINSCFGMEVNDDTFAVTGPPAIAATSQDTWFDHNVLWPTTQDIRGTDWDFDGMPNSSREDFYDLGDFVPLDWQTRYDDTIQERLAPNVVASGVDVPDFRVARYFADEIDTSITGNDGDNENLPYSRRLRLKDTNQRPLIAYGSTPLAESINDFDTWYSQWSVQAPKRDEEFACRRKVVILVTDGFDRCHWHDSDFFDFCPAIPETTPIGFCKTGGAFQCACSDPILTDPTNEISELAVDPADPEVLTFVVGFGVPEVDPNDFHRDEDGLDDMADAGGTGTAFIARNQAELQSALQSILTALESDNRTFASASIPAIQSSSADKVFLSSFTPIPFDPQDTATLSPNPPAPGFWPGRIDAFRKPLPLDANDQPDTARVCEDTLVPANNRQSGCHLFEVGDVLCETVATNLALAPDEPPRNVFYGLEHVAGSGIPGAARPVRARLLDLPDDVLGDKADDEFSDLDTDDQEWVEDLGKVFLNENALKTYLEEDPTNLVPNSFVGERLANVINTTVGLKGLSDPFVGDVEACDTDGDMIDDSFVMGDIFHASPLALSGPSNFSYFALDQCGLAQRTDIPSNCIPPDQLDFGEDRGYRRFTADHVWRRRMLLVPANDGQMHFFDTGVRQVVDDTSTTDPSDTVELFGDGFGTELFSYMPRLVMPIVKEQAEGVRHVYSMDGSVTVNDVFIDPIDDIGGQSTLTDRVWRTVVIGGLREAGDYFLVPERVENFKSGYFALDITQPDVVKERSSDDLTLLTCEDLGSSCAEGQPQALEYSPSCLARDSNGLLIANPDCPTRGNSALADLPFPAELWTFTDSRLLDEEPLNPINDLETYYLDEDPSLSNGHGVPDLGDAWSRPVVGQIEMCDLGGVSCDAGSGTDLITKHVAIFGGGMDPDSKDDNDPSEQRGAYLYMVDVETGFPVYKRKLGTGTGSAPADPAVLDIDNDGIFDVVYIGTTDGIMYKVDLKTPTGDAVPALVGHPITNDELIRASDFKTFTDVQDDDHGVTVSGTAVNFTTPRVDAAAWDPFPIFDTGGSPIYFAPSAFFIPERNRFGLAFGTGDREDLWSVPPIGPEARFIVFVDDDFDITDIPLPADTTACVAAGTTKAALPVTESCLVTFPFTEDPVDRNLLLDPPSNLDTTGLPSSLASAVLEQLRPGWVMTIPQTSTRESRVTTEAFVIAGIVVFSTFDPTTVAVAGSNDECERTGTTRAFVVQASNGSPVIDLNSTLPPPGGGSSQLADLTAEDRFQTIEEFTTAPFLERTSTKNQPSSTNDRTILDAIEEQANDTVREALVANLPRGSRFNDAFQVVISALRNSTGVEVYASIPIAIYPADWRNE